MNINNEMGIDSWVDLTGQVLSDWDENTSGTHSVDAAEDMARLLDVSADMLTKIDGAVSAYAAGAANVGDPDAVVSEVARILEGLDPTPHLDRTEGR